MNLAELPSEISVLFDDLNLPLRLKKHLQIVHTIAMELLKELKDEWPQFKVNENLILFGAATHDIGKVVNHSELFEPGKSHEMSGMQLLKKMGFEEEKARFAYSHGNWNDEGLNIEDYLVSLADKIWKGKRIDKLEEKLGREIALNLELDFWEVYPRLDTIIQKITFGADERMIWQNE